MPQAKSYGEHPLFFLIHNLQQKKSLTIIYFNKITDMYHFLVKKNLRKHSSTHRIRNKFVLKKEGHWRKTEV